MRIRSCPGGKTGEENAATGTLFSRRLPAKSRASSGLRSISIFNPPIAGEETHDEDGAYPPTGAIPPGQPRMFVKTVEDVRNAGQELVLAGGAAVSTRYLTAADNLGFSLHAVRLRAGASLELWYKHHWEANLILDGILDVTDHASSETHRLGPGALYLVGPADRHRIEAVDGVHLVSVFNPPLTGVESHDEDGAFPPTGPIPSGPVLPAGK